MVDATWGVIQPMTLASRMETVGEPELIEHLRAGRRLVDCRQPEYVVRGTIPGAVNIPYGEIVARIDELRPGGADRAVLQRPAVHRHVARDGGVAGGGLAGGEAALLPRRDPRLGDARSAARRGRELSGEARRRAGAQGSGSSEPTAPSVRCSHRNVQLHQCVSCQTCVNPLSCITQTYRCVDEMRLPIPSKPVARRLAIHQRQVPSRTIPAWRGTGLHWRGRGRRYIAASGTLIARAGFAAHLDALGARDRDRDGDDSPTHMAPRADDLPRPRSRRHVPAAAAGRAWRVDGGHAADRGGRDRRDDRDLTFCLLASQLAVAHDTVRVKAGPRRDVERTTKARHA